MLSQDYNLQNLRQITIKKRGFKMYITPRFINHYVENEYEDFTADIISLYAKPESTFVDVGAHYGFFSLLVAKNIPSSKIIAIEPVAENFKILNKNILLNKFNNITAYNVAVSNSTMIKKFHIAEASDSCSFYNHPLTKTTEIREVKTICLDELLKNQPIDFIKIDVDGHEIKILQGMKNILKNKNTKLIVEFNPKTLRSAGNKPEELLSILRNSNFDIFLIKEKDRQIFRISEDFKLWKNLMGEFEYSNLFCIKKENSLSVAFFSHSPMLGGAEQSLLELIKGLIKKNVLATVILPNRGPFTAELEKLKIPFLITPYSWWCELHKKNTNYLIEKNSWNLENLQEIYKFFNLSNPHLIYSNTLTIPWGGLIAKSLGIPHIWHINEFGREDHGLIFDISFKDISKFIEKYSQIIIANSKAVANNLSLYLSNKSKICVCYNGVELKNQKNVKIRQIFHRKNTLKIIFVGALTPGKNQKEAVLAANELKKQGVNFELALLGPCYFPNYRQELKRLISQYQLEDYIKIYGPIKNVKFYFQQADFALLCSRKEAFARTIIEAMLCRKPVIGSKTGGIPEIIKDGYNGLLYPIGNYRELATKIIYFYYHRQKILEFGENGYKLVKKNFTEDKYCSRIYQIMIKLKNKNQKTNEFNALLLKSFLKLLNNKNNQILLLDKEVQHKEKEVRTLNLDIVNKEIQLNKCLSDLNRIHNSKTWKLLKLYQLFINQPITIKNKLFNQNLLSYLGKFFSQLKPVNYNNAHTFDLFYFPIIDWHFRFQRPQQICLQLAKYGHRIFYIKPSWTVIAHPLLSREQIAAKVRIGEIAQNIFEITLVNYRRINIYQDMLSEKDKQYLTWSMEIVQEKMNIKQHLAMIAFPFWDSLLNNHWKIIYDCMDEHSGFTNISQKVVLEEHKLIRRADLITYSSHQLMIKNKKLNSKYLLIKNASDFNYFSQKIKTIPPDLKALKHPLIGYYGAIADWFDDQLVEYLALKRPQWQFIFIGHVMDNKINLLRKLSNIHFLGEKPYKTLSSYLCKFDCFIIPFKLNKLILATNPVKAYEVLASGKPVVSVNLPELKPMKKLLYLAKNKIEFLAKIERALAEKQLPLTKKKNLINQRIIFAKQNTWENRANNLMEGINNYLYPKVSIIIISYNTYFYLKKCLESVYQYSNYPNFELIIIDNNSNDKSKKYLESLKNKDKNLKIIFSKKNLGFSAGNNLGIKKAHGEYIILLNADTVVTENWVMNLINYLKDPKIGLVGPVSNNIGNEAKINLKYRNLRQMHQEAKRYSQSHRGSSFEIPMLAFFCVAGRKSLFDKIGLLDEKYSVGFFEDDDYCYRVKLTGFKLLCAEDVFIHHYGNQSFKTASSSYKKKIFTTNKRLYEQKWKTKWKSHQYRKIISS